MRRRPESATAARPQPPGRLRVAVVSDGIYPFFKGGKEVRYHELLRRIAASGVHVDVYTMHWWQGPRRRQQDGINYRAICRAWPMYKDDRRSMVQAVMFAVATLKMITRPFDLIDADHMPYLQLFPLRLVATLRRVPLVVSWNEWWGQQYWLTYLGQAGRVAASVERVGARTGDHIVALTSATAARLHAAGVAPERVSVQGLGVDRRAIEEAVPCAQAYDVVYVGRLIEHKGVDLLLSALAKLRQEGTTVTCGIAGEGPEQGRLRRQCTQLGLDDVVTFIGALEARSEVFGLIKAARVFAYPSVREGYGLAVAEALACGTRVITVDHPDNHSQHLIVDEPLGLLCRPDAESFAAALHAILSQSLGPTTGRSAVAARDWDDCADDLLQIYRAQVREK